MSGPGKSTGRDARSTARLAAVQGLYQMDMAATDLSTVIHDLTVHPIRETADGAPEPEAEDEAPDIDATFMSELLRGVVRRQREIDPLVEKQLATGWRLGRVDSILRAILRAGAFELIERADVPGRVVINEYIDIAHAFFAGDEPKVVNGVLDKLARRLRPAEFATA